METRSETERQFELGVGALRDGAHLSGRPNPIQATATDTAAVDARFVASLHAARSYLRPCFRFCARDRSVAEPKVHSLTGAEAVAG